MIRLETFGETAVMRAVADRIDDAEGVSHVRLVEATRPGHSVLVARVRPTGVDGLLATLRHLEVREADIVLTRSDLVGRASAARDEHSLVWEDVLGAAWLNSRPVATYLAFMFVAGVIACYGVLDDSGILIVGAMAVSPDLLPITAIGVAVVSRRAQLATRALLTLLIGLGVTIGTAAGLSWLLRELSLIPAGFSFGDTTVFGSLTTVNDETVIVALAAGVAGMLALETRASAGVGVAISVTTIPAAAYMGVAIGLSGSDALGALAVLSVNVAMLVVGASATLAIQSRSSGRGGDGPPPDDSPIQGDVGAGGPA